MHALKLMFITVTFAAWSVAAQAHLEDGAVKTEIIDNLPQLNPAIKSTPNEAAARKYFTDTELVEKDGHKVRFYTDVLKDRVVLINFIFTDCSAACPMLTQKLKQVKEALGERFGKDVFFVSISIDPDKDTPAALREFARRQDVEHPAWAFLTGDKANVEYVVKKLGQYNRDIEQHSTLILAGNVRTRHWSKIPPMAKVLEIAMKLEAFAAEP
jgi:protein SCO1/2